MKKTFIAIMTVVVMLLTGCGKVARVNFNIKEDANNFKVRRRVIALNTRTNEPLFTVEGYISIETDDDGDLNVTIKTGKDDYKLFYAHLSDDVTYTSIQLDDLETNPYAYEISFFPLKETLVHGLISGKSSD